MKQFTLFRPSIVVVVIAAILMAGLLPAMHTAQAAGSITLPRTTVPTGANVAVSGAGFTAQDTVLVYIDAPVAGKTRRIQSITPTGNGSFTAHLSLPGGVAPGTYTLTAKDTHGISATAHLTILPILILHVGTGKPGITVVDRHPYFVSADGFANGEQVKIQATFPTYSGNDIVQTRTVTADAHGTVTEVTLSVPSGAKIGWADVTAVGQTSTKQAQGRVYVVYRPYIFVSQKSVTAGSVVTVNGRGYAPNVGVRVQITIATSNGPQTLAVTAGTNGDGNFSRSIRIPSYANSGTYTVVATGVATGLKRYAKVTVGQAAPAPKPTPQPTAKPNATLRVAPSVTLPNQTIALEGTGYAAGSNVTISATVDLRGGGNRYISTVASVSSDGTFATSLRIPAKAAEGTYQLTASASGTQATADLQILPVSAHPSFLNFSWISLWYHTVRQGTYDYVEVQSTLKTTLGIWVHIIFPNGKHKDIYTGTDAGGHWAMKFTIPHSSVTKHSNRAFVTFQLWHGKQTTQSFLGFTLV